MSTAKDRFETKLSTKSPGFQRNCRSMLSTFLDRYNLTFEDIYVKQVAIERAIQNGEMEPYENDWLPDLVKGFMQDMIKEGRAPGYARQIYSYMRFFCRASKINFELDREDLPQGESIGKTVISHRQILKIWDLCIKEFKLRNRALIAFLKDSGLRPIDVSGLDVADYLRALKDSPHEGFAKFRPIITTKKGRRAYPRIGPDAVEALDLYLNGRETGPLFESKEMIEGTKYPKEELKRMSSMDISSVFSRLTKGLSNGDRVSAYSLRKFHSTSLNAPRPDLELPSMEEAYIAILQGKKRPGTFGPYNQPWETGQLLEEYVRHYPKLSLKPQAVNGRIKDLEAELARLKGNEDRLAKLEAVSAQLIEELRALKAEA
jgi:integrase